MLIANPPDFRSASITLMNYVQMFITPADTTLDIAPIKYTISGSVTFQSAVSRGYLMFYNNNEKGRRIDYFDVYSGSEDFFFTIDWTPQITAGTKISLYIVYVEASAPFKDNHPITFDFTGRDKLTASAGNSIGMEGAASVTLSEATVSGGKPPYTYSWSPTTDLNNSSILNPVCSTTKTTIYTLTVEDSSSPVKQSATSSVTVFPDIVTGIPDDDDDIVTGLPEGLVGKKATTPTVQEAVAYRQGVADPFTLRGRVAGSEPYVTKYVDGTITGLGDFKPYHPSSTMAAYPNPSQSKSQVDIVEKWNADSYMTPELQDQNKEVMWIPSSDISASGEVKLPQPANLVLYDKNQQVRYQGQSNVSPAQLPLQVSPGIYFLHVEFQGKVRRQQLLVE